MGLATSDLSTIATLVPEFTILAYTLTMWGGKALLCLGTLLLLGWQYVVRYGLNLDNPVNTYSGTDQYDAGVYFFANLGGSAVVFTILAIFTTVILAVPSVLPFWDIIPSSLLSMLAFKGRWTRKKNGAMSPAASDDENKGVNKEDILNIPRPTGHVFVTFLIFLFTVPTPHIIFSLLADSAKLTAVLCFIIIPVAGYVMCYVYWIFRTALPIFGQTEKNTAEYNKFNKAAIDSGDMKALVWVKDTMAKDTRNRILFTVLAIGVPHVFGNLALGIARYFSEDVDVNWIVAIVFGIIIFVLTIIAALWFWYISSPEDPFAESDDVTCKRKKMKKEEETTEDEDGEVDLEEISEEPKPSKMPEGKSNQSYYGADAHNISQRQSFNIANGLFKDL
jgi:hypothetical protein